MIMNLKVLVRFPSQAYCNDRTLDLATKVQPADLSDFPFVCRQFLSVSSRKYSVLILLIHEVAVPPFSYV